jgi:ribosome-associated translation inhibitor RaiA
MQYRRKKMSKKAITKKASKKVVSMADVKAKKADKAAAEKAKLAEKTAKLETSFGVDIKALQTEVKGRTTKLTESITSYVYKELDRLVKKYASIHTQEQVVMAYNEGSPFPIKSGNFRTWKTNQSTDASLKTGKAGRAAAAKVVKVNPVASVIKKLDKMTAEQMASQCFKLYASLTSEAKALFHTMAGLSVSRATVRAAAMKVKK